MFLKGLSAQLAHPCQVTVAKVVGKSLEIAFKRRCPDLAVLGPAGLIRDTVVEQGFKFVFLGVDLRVVLRSGSTFLAIFFFFMVNLEVSYHKQSVLLVEKLNEILFLGI